MNFASLTPEQQQQVLALGAQRYRNGVTAEQLAANGALAAQLMQAAGIMPQQDADLVRQGIDWLDASGMPMQNAQPAAAPAQPPMPPKRPANLQGAGNAEAPSPPRRPADLPSATGSAGEQSQKKATDSPSTKTSAATPATGSASAGKQQAPAKPEVKQPPIETISTMDGYEQMMAPEPLVVDVAPRRAQTQQDPNAVAENPRTPLAPANDSWANTVRRSIRDFQSKMRMNPNNPARPQKAS